MCDSADSWRAARQLPRVLPDQHRVGAGYTKFLQRLLHESCQMLKPASNARIELVWRVDVLCQILPGISLHPETPRPQSSTGVSPDASLLTDMSSSRPSQKRRCGLTDVLADGPQMFQVNAVTVDACGHCIRLVRCPPQFTPEEDRYEY